MAWTPSFTRQLPPPKKPSRPTRPSNTQPPSFITRGPPRSWCNSFDPTPTRGYNVHARNRCRHTSIAPRCSWGTDIKGDKAMGFQIREVHEPPASCKGCRLYDKYRDDCRSVIWHLVKERRGEALACPSKETGSGLYCPGGKCYGCTPGAGCDDYYFFDSLILASPLLRCCCQRSQYAVRNL